MGVVGNGAWRMAPMKASRVGVYRVKMVGNMRKERNKYLIEGMYWRSR